MKRTLSTLLVVLLGSVGQYACDGSGDDDDTNPGQPGGKGGSAGSGGASSGAGGGAGAGAGGSAGSGGGASCDAARGELLAPIDEVSPGDVTVTSDADETRTLFVDASSNGQPGANPRVYLDLSGSVRVDVSDVEADESSDWDIALERSVIFANGGDGGPGGRTVATLAKAFADVTADDAAAAAFDTESFFEADCTPKTDAIGAPLTTFADWYDYDLDTNILTPRVQTYLVRRDDDTIYKVSVESFYTSDDGTPDDPDVDGTDNSGKFLLQIAPIEP